MLLAVALVAAAGTTTAAAAGVAEPAGLWTGAMGGETPATLAGATVLNLQGLERLLALSSPREKPVLLDTAASPSRPEGLAADRPWLPVHRSLPGSIWLPGAGAADLGARHAALASRIAELTGGDKARPVITFCQPHCWASWNTAKRLVELGYTRVYWFPGGVVEWQDRHNTAVTTRDPQWSASGKPTD